ncbi:DNA excision repair protein ERCC-1 [Nematocida sp. AWRm77]|nr:DNA excision repair protein ERCC-1 [Nematocida sp. AWRm77]
MGPEKSIRVSETQRGNALLRHLKRARVVFAPLLFDFEPGSVFGVLYLTLRLHIENPSYLYKRIEEIKGKKTIRKVGVLLLVDTPVDTPRAVHAFSTLQIECLGMGAQVFTAYTSAESAMYIENMHGQRKDAAGKLRNYKYTLSKHMRTLSKPGIEAFSLSEYSRKALFLTSIPKITSKDTTSLLAAHGTLREVLEAMDKSSPNISGIGKIKEHAFKKFTQHAFR